MTRWSKCGTSVPPGGWRTRYTAKAARSFGKCLSCASVPAGPRLIRPVRPGHLKPTKILFSSPDRLQGAPRPALRPPSRGSREHSRPQNPTMRLQKARRVHTPPLPGPRSYHLPGHPLAGPGERGPQALRAQEPRTEREEQNSRWVARGTPGQAPKSAASWQCTSCCGAAWPDGRAFGLPEGRSLPSWTRTSSKRSGRRSLQCWGPRRRHDTDTGRHRRKHHGAGSLGPRGVFPSTLDYRAWKAGSSVQVGRGGSQHSSSRTTPRGASAPWWVRPRRLGKCSVGTQSSTSWGSSSRRRSTHTATRSGRPASFATSELRSTRPGRMDHPPQALGRGGLAPDILQARPAKAWT